MTDFESEQYLVVVRQRDEAITLLKWLLKVMKDDQREGDRYVYEEDAKIKAFLKKVKG